MDDILAWHYNKNGLFMVRAAYKLYMSIKGDPKLVGNMHLHLRQGEGTTNVGRGCGRLTVRRRSCISYGGSVITVLLCSMNIKMRSMKLDTRFILYGRHDEDGGHLFLKCKHVRKLWKELNLEHIRE